MIISLLGYMGSGKSHISKILGAQLMMPVIDLDKEISRKQGGAVKDIFKAKGEIYFRKKEREALEEILAQQDNIVLSLGGGTPCYYNNMDLINDRSVSIYLRTSVTTLADRLKSQKEKRPLIAHLQDEELPEFIAKHLFERNAFYSKAQFSVDTDHKKPESVVQEIVSLLDYH